jgi:hypothetical protein
MSDGADNIASNSSADAAAAAEDAVRALWSSLDRLDHSLTYLLPENAGDAVSGKRPEGLLT